MTLRAPLSSYDVDSALRAYRESGFALIPGVASDPTLEALRERTRAIMLGEVVHEGLFFQLDGQTGAFEDLTFGRGWEGPSENYRKIEKLERDAVFRAWMDNPLFERIARGVIQGPVVTYRAIVMSKAPHGGSDLPWHQDAGAFWGLDRDPELQVWTALDDAPIEAGCVELLPGSHKDGLVRPLGGLVDVVRAREKNAEVRAERVPARAGDVMLIHNYVWHRSGRNHTSRPRRAFSVCYMSESIHCVRKKRKPRVFPRAFEAQSR
jgi:phytanoyl-CoA hydroxylase